MLVNSAGYALLGAVEDMTCVQSDLGEANFAVQTRNEEKLSWLTLRCSDAEMLAQMDTNFFGCLRTIKGALPAFRERKNGTVVNINSVAGIVGRPSRGLYSGSKFALEGRRNLQWRIVFSLLGS